MNPRRHRDHVVYLILNGRVLCHIEGQEKDWQSGGCYWIAPEVHHQARPLGPPPRFIVLRVGLHDGNRPLLPPRPYQTLTDGLQIRPYLDQIITAQQAAGPLQAWRLRGALLQCFARLQECLDDQNHRQGGLRLDEKHKLLAYLHRHLDQALQAADLARLLGRSPSNLRRAFQRSYGLSPRAWLHRQRLLHAQALLVDDQTGIAGIATACGYQSAASFSRLFKEAFGRSPLAWRQDRQLTTPDT